MLQEIILELILVGKMEVSHAFDDLLDSSRAIAEYRVNLLLIIDNIVQGTETFIVVQEGPNLRVVTSEEFRGRLHPKKRESKDGCEHSGCRHGNSRWGNR